MARDGAFVAAGGGGAAVAWLPKHKAGMPRNDRDRGVLRRLRRNGAADKMIWGGGGGGGGRRPAVAPSAQL